MVNNLPRPDADAGNRLLRANAERRMALAATMETLAPGVTIRKDGPPGVGWRLEKGSLAPRYLATRELAITRAKVLGWIP